MYNGHNEPGVSFVRLLWFRFLIGIMFFMIVEYACESSRLGVLNRTAIFMI